MKTDRRSFISSLTGIVLSSTVFSPSTFAAAYATEETPIACNQYPWITFYKRAGRDWSANLDTSLAEFASTGLKGYEPIIDSLQEVEVLAPLLKKHDLQLYSIYVNSVLHDDGLAQKTMKTVMETARRTYPLGTRIFVTNPMPLSWDSVEDKTDKQLEIQAKNLNELGRQLREAGITLAYHNHDAEMRQSAREFHHMMLATEPENVKLCLDSQWIYRGSGNSQVALFDIVKLYGKRIVELHLRQSEDGIWKETFSKGDIDYARLQNELKNLGVEPHLVLEQAVEEGTPQTLNAVQACKQSLKYVRKLFT